MIRNFTSPPMTPDTIPAKAAPGLDPKGEAGKAKAPLALIPPEALRQAAWAHGTLEDDRPPRRPGLSPLCPD